MIISNVAMKVNRLQMYSTFENLIPTLQFYLYHKVFYMQDSVPLLHLSLPYPLCDANTRHTPALVVQRVKTNNQTSQHQINKVKEAKKLFHEWKSKPCNHICRDSIVDQSNPSLLHTKDTFSLLRCSWFLWKNTSTSKNQQKINVILLLISLAHIHSLRNPNFHYYDLRRNKPSHYTQKPQNRNAFHVDNTVSHFKRINIPKEQEIRN